MSAKKDTERIRTKQKINKWDQIKHKYVPKDYISNCKIIRFLERDLIGESEISSLYGCDGGSGSIDPCVLMNARHEAIKQSNKSRVNDVCSQIDTNVSALIQEENQYIKRELLKYKEVYKLQTGTRQQTRLNSSSKTDEYNFNNFATGLGEMVFKSELFLKEKDCLNYGDLKSIGDKPKKIFHFGKFIEIYDYNASKIYKSNSSGCLAFVRVENKTIVCPTERKPIQLKNSHEIVENSISHKTNIKQLGNMESGTAISALKIKPLQVTIPPNWNDFGFGEISSSPCSTPSNSNDRNDIISKLFSEHFYRENFLIRTYFLKWLHFMTVQKISCQTENNKTDRIHKINVFLDRIKNTRKNYKAKAKTHLIRDCSKDHISTLAKQYQKKVKMQQDIINLQKLKLNRQERTIMELRLCRLAEDATESKLNIKQGLQEVLKKGSFKHKTRAKCLQITASLHGDDNNLTKLQGEKLNIPRFLANMQARAWERRVRHEKAKQRRIQLEAEREAVKHAAEEAKRMEDEEAKKMRIELLKEKRRQEKLEKYNREKERQKCIENNKKAQEFYRTFLMKKIGLEVFKRLLKRKRINKKKSDKLRNIIFYKHSLNSWKSYIKAQWDRKFLVADKHYENTTKISFFKAWCGLLKDSESKFLAATDWHEYKVTERCLMYWDEIIKTNRLIEEAKIKQAESHYDWHMKWNVLDHWRRLPHILKLEKITQERRLRWRMKIWELLPDYRPISHDAH